MRRRILVSSLAAVFALGLGIVLIPSAFVYQPIPVPPNNVSRVYLDQLQAISPVVGKKVIFPPGLIDYASQENLHVQGFFGLGNNLSQKYPYTIRDYLEERRRNVGLQWKYDVAQNAIVFDFAWRHPVSHTGRELVEQMGKLFPVPLHSLDWEAEWKLDPWRQALDELMSEPENFPHAWKARLQGSCSEGGSMLDAIAFDDNSYSHILKDTDGQEHLLVLHANSPMTTKDRWHYIYYLFAADGKWEEAGTFETSSIYTHPNVLFDPGKKWAMIEINFTPIQFTDSTGKVTTMESGYHLGDFAHYLLKIEHGKLVPSVETNLSNLNPLDETFGMSSFRHLAD